MIKSRGFANAILSINLHQFENIKNFLNEVQLLWNEKLNDYEEMGNEIEDEEERNEFFDFYYDDWVVYRDEYPRLANYNGLVSCYSYFEKLCSDYYRRVLQFNPDFEGMKKRNIYALDYIKWFEKKFEKQILNEEKLEQFSHFHQIRNRIVHSNGKVDKIDHKELVGIISELKWVELNRHNELEISIEYIEEAIEMLSDSTVLIHNCVYVKQ